MGHEPGGPRQPAAVDFARRRCLLAETDGLTPEDAMARLDDGLPKLRLRAGGSTRGVASRPPSVALARGGRVVAVAPRRVLALERRGRGDTVLDRRALEERAGRGLLSPADARG